MTPHSTKERNHALIKIKLHEVDRLFLLFPSSPSIGSTFSTLSAYLSMCRRSDGRSEAALLVLNPPHQGATVSDWSNKSYFIDYINRKSDG